MITSVSRASIIKTFIVGNIYNGNLGTLNDDDPKNCCGLFSVSFML